MAHEINELAPGVHSIAVSREAAWHRLGVTLESDMTAEQALTAAHLSGWNVRKIPMTASDVTETGVTTVEVPDRFATVYTNPVTGRTQYLGVVGGYYEPMQNEETIDLLQAISGESGAVFETAGSIREGRETFVSMRVPRTMLVGGVDPVDLYLTALNSHDGTTSQRTIVAPVRVLCANTQAAALRTAKSTFAIRHTRGSKASAIEARRVLGLAFKYVDEFEEEANRMIEQALTDHAFQQIVGEVFGAGPQASTRAQNIAAKHTAAVFDLWKNDPAHTMSGLGGTAWGGYQAVTEYTDHFMPVRTTGFGSTSFARAQRAATSADLIKIKHDAFTQFAAAPRRFAVAV